MTFKKRELRDANQLQHYITMRYLATEFEAKQCKYSNIEALRRSAYL